MSQKNEEIQCKNCGKPLSQAQINMLGNLDYSEWCREGFCSLTCFNGDEKIGKLSDFTKEEVTPSKKNYDKPISDTKCEPGVEKHRVLASLALRGLCFLLLGCGFVFLFPEIIWLFMWFIDQVAGKGDRTVPLDEMIEKFGLAMPRFIRMGLGFICFVAGGWSGLFSSDVRTNALHRAVKAGKSDSLRNLLGKGYNPNERNGHGQSALHTACAAGSKEMVQMLVEAGASVRMRAHATNSLPLTIAIGCGHLDVVKTLLEMGADCKKSDEPMLAAAQGGSVAIVEMLLKAGASPDVTGPFSVDDNTGAYVRVRASYDNTLLMIAAYQGHSELVAYLVSHGADPSQVNADGLTALELARKAGHEEKIRESLQG